MIIPSGVWKRHHCRSWHRPVPRSMPICLSTITAITPQHLHQVSTVPMDTARSWQNTESLLMIPGSVSAWQSPATSCMRMPRTICWRSGSMVMYMCAGSARSQRLRRTEYGRSGVPIPGITVETTITPDAGGHTRVHKITSEIDCVAYDCGFAVSRGDFEEVGFAEKVDGMSAQASNEFCSCTVSAVLDENTQVNEVADKPP